MTPPEINLRGPSALEDIEDKGIPAQEGTKVLANDESDEEEEKDLGIAGIRGEENARSAKDDESQTKLMTLDTTGETLPKDGSAGLSSKKELPQKENKLKVSALCFSLFPVKNIINLELIWCC